MSYHSSRATALCTLRHHLPTCCFLAVLVAFLLPSAPAAAQEATAPTWQIGIKLKTLVNGHTSYEFGNPLPPYQQPLSRLEFPVDSVWAGLAIKKQFSRFSVGAEFLTTVADQESGSFKDTDWGDNLNPTRVTTRGAADTRLEPSYQVGVDLAVQVADLLRLPSQFDLQPVIGYRWQQLSLVAHDGVQTDYTAAGTASSVHLPGDLVSFEQNWHQYFAGLRLGYAWQDLPAWLHRLKAQTQLDWGHLEGDNRDNHLLRAGRISTMETSGDAWHASLGLQVGLTERLDLGIEADYLKLASTGTYTQRDAGSVASWSNGVKAWSEQIGLLLTVGYRY
ncbi:MAG: omptin family outer membrane protease [Geobacteraceae bacterium]|nr:omptin family outer membrane protease [Geobacteraceae bacterium]